MNKPRTKIGSTEIASRPDAKVIWYVDSCDSNRGAPEIFSMSDDEQAQRKIFEDTKKEGSGHYDVKLYIGLAIFDKIGEFEEIIDDEVVDGWYDEDANEML